ncbi:MAG TPA: DUF983 domain-containing protein [Pseudonocardiaceae bacterium]
MLRRVQTGDRQWTVTSTINWRQPATQQQFEHDVASGYVPGVVMLVVLVVMGLTVLLWTPPDVIVPSWVLLLFLVVLMMLPLQWAWERPWTVKAETDETAAIGGERWVGTVHGWMAARQEVSRATRYLKSQGVPDQENGRLRMIT